MMKFLFFYNSEKGPLFCYAYKFCIGWYSVEFSCIVIDWTNPASPVLMERADTIGFASDVTVINGRAYVADGGSGLVLLK